MAAVGCRVTALPLLAALLPVALGLGRTGGESHAWTEAHKDAPREDTLREEAAPRALSAESHFDCDAGIARWRTGWSRTKKEWCCCRMSAVGAFVSCKQVAPTVKDRAHVCKTYHFTATTGRPTRTTTPGVFSCDSDHHSAWSAEKREWCCLHEGRGCPDLATSPHPHQCLPGSEHAWSAAHRRWCCSFAGRGCPETTSASPASTTGTAASGEHHGLDCQPTITNLVQYWSDTKKKWCCKYHHHGCRRSESRSEPHFDCQVGLATWRMDWSDTKKEWCCKNHKLGCAPQFDCTDGLQAAWTAKKQEYCCNEEHMGCTTSTTVQSHQRFDCQAGLSLAHRGWSDAKKSWCCDNKGLGCPVTTTSQPVDLDGVTFDCSEGNERLEMSWSQTKRLWCCRTSAVGCPTTVTTTPSPPPGFHFDCTVDSSNWKRSWSSTKAKWCCANEGVGCSSDDDDDDDDDDGSGPQITADPYASMYPPDSAQPVDTLQDESTGGAQEDEDEPWEVIFPGSVRVRKAKSTGSDVVMMKDRGTIIHGHKEGNWLALHGEPGYMMIKSDDGEILVTKMSQARLFAQRKYEQRYPSVEVAHANLLGPSSLLIAAGTALAATAAVAGLRSRRAAVGGWLLRQSAQIPADARPLCEATLDA